MRIFIGHYIKIPKVEVIKSVLVCSKCSTVYSSLGFQVKQHGCCVNNLKKYDRKEYKLLGKKDLCNCIEDYEKYIYVDSKDGIILIPKNLHTGFITSDKVTEIEYAEYCINEDVIEDISIINNSFDIDINIEFGMVIL